MQRRRPFFLLFLFLVLSSALPSGARVLSIPIPAELKSSQFTVEVNGKPVDVVHAAANYDYVSLESTEPIRLSITATQHRFWDHGVDVQPWRFGIRPTRNGDTIEFPLSGPAKLSISRPQDFLNRATMLFIFVSRPTTEPPAATTSLPSYHFIAPGIHREGLNPKSGDTYYLASGAVIYGSLNLWDVHDVAVLGRGVIVYDGPQNPDDDDGWMQKRDWHCIGANNAHHIRISGLTCLVRSRTWSIQMKDSTDFQYDDLRVIGGNPGNANQDGMDWLGGGDTTVRDSFFRTSDDVFAMQGNWDGYGRDKMIIPGHDVANILIEGSVLSTSISNIVRAGWPEKIFNTHNFTLRDSDILHGGIGSCGLPFALFTFWGTEGAKGEHSGYTFENLRLDNWYSLFQIEQEEPAIHGFTFRNIWALGQPPLATSRIAGDVKDIHIDNLKYGPMQVYADIQIPLTVDNGAQEPVYTPVDPRIQASFHVSPATLQTQTTATFVADAPAGSHLHYQWLFGDGTTAQGQRVRHRFPDAMGTQLDGNGAGIFRVLLHADDGHGHEDWSEQSIVVVSDSHQAATLAPNSTQPGLAYNIYPGTWPELPSFAAETPVISGVTDTLANADSGGFTRYAISYDGYLEVPTEGGYSFHIFARDGARLIIDGQAIAQTGIPFAEVCGSPVNAVRYAHGAIGLRAGKHIVRIEALQSVSPESPRILWEGPGINFSEVPTEAISHSTDAVLKPRPAAPPSSISAIAP